MRALDLVAVRHGNTFAPGDPVTWVGRGQDLPLVEKGREQAQALGRHLAAGGWRPDRVLTGTLRRTRGHARELLAAAGWGGPEPEEDPRLDEVDYGPWGGRTSAEIEARGEGEALAAWSALGRWPAAFLEREEDVRGRIAALAEELAAGADGRVLLVSSNGVLRYLLALVPGELERRRGAGALKVGTGRAGRLRRGDAGWELLAWDAAAPLDHGR